ncbi:hypothetical protein GCM10010304_77590 [Streptomyces roseoviolaceus]
MGGGPWARGAGYDGVVNDSFLVRTAGFNPRGALYDGHLAAENITGLEWWHPQEVACYDGPDLFPPPATLRLL